MAAWLVALMILPAAPAAWALSRAIRGGWEAVLAISLALSVAAAAVAGLLGWVFDLTLGTGIAIHVVLLLVCDVGFVMRSRGLRKLPLRRDLPVFTIWLVTGVLALWERAWMAPNMDVFYHIAAARSLLYFDRVMVTDPFYGVGSNLPDPTSGAANSLLGMSSAVSGIDPAALWAGFNVLAALMVPAVFWMLFRQLRAPRTGAIAATLALTFLATSADFRFAGYPNQFGVSLTIVALAGLAAAVRGRKAGWPIALIGTVAAASTHTGVALTLIAVSGVVAVGMALYARFAEADREVRLHLVRRVWVVCGSMMLVGLVSVAPRLWFVSGAGAEGGFAPAQSSGLATAGLYRLFGIGLLYDPEVAFGGGVIVIVMGTAVAALTLWASVKERNDLAALAAIVALVPVAVGFNPVLTPILAAISPYITWRMLTLMRYAPYLALPLAWDQQRALTRVALIGAIVVTLPSLHMQFSGEPPVSIRPGVINVSIWDGWTFDFRSGANAKMIGAVAGVFGDEWPTVATDPMTGYGIGGLVPCHPVAITSVHAPLFLEVTREGDARRKDMAALLGDNTGSAMRERIVRRYDVDYVLLWPGRVNDEARRKIVEDTDTFEVVYDYRKATLLRVRDEQTGGE